MLLAEHPQVMIRLRTADRSGTSERGSIEAGWEERAEWRQFERQETPQPVSEPLAQLNWRHVPVARVIPECQWRKNKEVPTAESVHGDSPK